jgi:hypothetical protein
MPIDIQMPPAAYVRHYDGPLTIIDGTLKVTRAMCAALKTPHANEAYGCQVFYGDKVASSGPVALPWCQVFVATDIDPATMLRVLAHEIAHCNGWRHD